MTVSFPEPTMIACNDVELEVYQAGEGGIPVVLAHGWPEHAYSWRYQVPALVEAGYHVIVPNQRGYGASSQPEAVEAYDASGRERPRSCHRYDTPRRDRDIQTAWRCPEVRYRPAHRDDYSG